MRCGESANSELRIADVTLYFEIKSTKNCIFLLRSVIHDVYTWCLLMLILVILLACFTHLKLEKVS